MSKHTKGPWKTASVGRRAITGPEGQPVVFYGDGIVVGMSSPTEEERANYRLLLHAAEMFQELEELYEIHPYVEIRELLDRIADGHVCEYQSFTGDTERRCAICQKLM